MNIVQTPLTQEQKKKIWLEIMMKMNADDKDPCEVIRDNYGGDEEKYLRDMVSYLGLVI